MGMHVDLAGDGVGNERGAVFFDEVDFALGAFDGGVKNGRFLLNISRNCNLLIIRWTNYWHIEKIICIHSETG